MCLCHRTTIDLFVGFRMDDSDNIATSIKQISYIKSMFISMLHRISKHLRITNYIGVTSFLLAITLDAMSFFYVFSILICVYCCYESIKIIF